MKKAMINALVDLAALIAFIPSLISGIVLLLAPEGGGYRGGTGPLAAQIYLGLSRGEWRALHDVASLIFTALVIAHLLLHLSYFRNIRRFFKKTDVK